MSKQRSSREVIVKRSEREVTDAVCRLFRDVICRSVRLGQKCRLALAGGTTPHALYQALAGRCAAEEIPWSGVEVFFGDERDVPQDHIESNYGMVQRTLLDHLPIPPDQVHPMPADAGDLEVAATEYERCVRELVPAGKDGIPQFDLVLLGMGADGHTASLFPFTEVLDEKEKLVMAYFVPVLGRQRMTFTFPLINAARHVILLVTGSDKAKAVAAMLGDDRKARERLPAARITPTEGKLIVVVDSRAARAAGLKPK